MAVARVTDIIASSEKSWEDAAHVALDREAHGLETLDEHLARMVAVFREVRRVLRDDGTLWLNVGDSYASAQGGPCIATNHRDAPGCRVNPTRGALFRRIDVLCSRGRRIGDTPKCGSHGAFPADQRAQVIDFGYGTALAFWRPVRGSRSTRLSRLNRDMRT